MKASEIILEVFQSGKTNWEWARLGRDEASAFFNVGGREYLWQAFTPRSNPKKWEIQFRLIRKPDVDPDDLDLFGTTGTGNSTEVMSTAVDITRAFLKDYGLDNVEEITFNAKEDSRIGLYAKMIKRLLPNWDLHSRKDPHDGMVFTLTDRRAYDKPENKLNEIGNTFYDVDQTSAYSPSKNIRIKHAKGVTPFVPKTRANFKFRTDSGTQYVINLSMMKSPKNGRTGVEVVFYDDNEDDDDKIGITNKGDAVKVFSTVKAVLTKFLSEHPQASVVAFSAKTDEPSRVKLYQTFANQFTRWFPKFSEQKVYRHPDYTTFAMMIPKNGTVEEEVLDEMPLPTDWDPAALGQGTSFKARLAYALERAKKLGTGSSRVAMTIEYQGRPTVLKIAKNAKGLAQNSVEASILDDGYASQLGILIPIIDYDEQHRDPHWIHTELAHKATEKQLCAIMKCRSLSELVDMAWTITGKRRRFVTHQQLVDRMIQQGISEEDIETMTSYANVLADLHSSFDIELGDFTRKANWGLYNGKPVIVDVGFNSNVLDQYYK